MSIKDCIAQQDCDATCGAAARAFKPYSEDAVSVKLLRDAGNKYTHTHTHIYIYIYIYIHSTHISGLFG